MNWNSVCVKCWEKRELDDTDICGICRRDMNGRE